MLRRTLVLFLLVLLGIRASGWPLRPVHTFSIVAFDPATGEMGVAVQSHLVCRRRRSRRGRKLA
jgi:hypothetical protein